MKVRVNLIVFLFFIILFSDCTLQKRSYRDGYYFSRNKNHSKISESQISKQQNFKTPDLKTTFISQTSAANKISESSFSLPPLTPILKLKNKKPGIIAYDGCGDEITFKNGDEVKAKVLEINENEIKYKRCDNLDGPIIVVNKSEVFMIKYLNGSKEVFKDVTPKQNSIPANNNNNNIPFYYDNRQTSPLAIISLVMGILVFFTAAITAIPAIITGSIALHQINTKPNQYKGHSMATTGIVLGITAAIIALIIIFLIYAFAF